MHRLIPAVATIAMAASVTVAVSPASADGSTINSAGYLTSDGKRGVVDLTATGAKAVVPGTGPIVVALGDSYISGEAGRWAGNVIKTSNFGVTDALSYKAYDDAGADEAIKDCHRSRQAEVNFTPAGSASVNLACSGATALSDYSSKSNTWKPGIDFAQQKVRSGAVGVGQAQLLQNLASANPGRIGFVVLSIGGNDFDFGQIVATCVEGFIKGGPCSKEKAVTSKVEEPNISTQRNKISAAIDRLISAVGDKGAPNWTLLVQDYPSPVATSSTIRYGETYNQRWGDGGCPMYNVDLDWANEVALTKIDQTVREAVDTQRVGHPDRNIQFLELKDALKGHRLCEKNVYPVDQPFGPVRSWWRKGAVDSSEWVQSIRILGKFTRDLAIWPFKTQESLHPNYWAQLAYQSCLTQAYGDGTAVIGGTCLYGGTGLDANGRPRMDLMSFASKKNPAGTAPEKVRNLTKEKFTKRAFKVRWEDPAEVKPGMRFVYRLKTPDRAWKGWLQAGTSHAIVVGTPQKGVYKVQVAAKWGKERGEARSLTYRNR
jgi:hypothetical protein